MKKKCPASMSRVSMTCNTGLNLQTTNKTGLSNEGDLWAYLTGTFSPGFRVVWFKGSFDSRAQCCFQGHVSSYHSCLSFVASVPLWGWLLICCVKSYTMPFRSLKKRASFLEASSKKKKKISNPTILKLVTCQALNCGRGDNYPD